MSAHVVFVELDPFYQEWIAGFFLVSYNDVKEAGNEGGLLTLIVVIGGVCVAL